MRSQSMNMRRWLTGGLSRRRLSTTLMAGGLLASDTDAPLRRANAQATPAAAPTKPDVRHPVRYRMKGTGLELDYVPASGRLSYRDADGTRMFEVKLTRDEALGPSISAIMNAVADGFTRYLTVLVPDVNGPEAGSSVPIRALAILTNHRTSIGGPALVRGPIQTYDAIQLTGTAEFETK